MKTAAREVEAAIVVGAANSSNSQRLREVAEREGCIAQLVADERGIDWAALENVRSVAVTAGASAPEALVERILEALARALRRRARDADDGERVDGVSAAARAARAGVADCAPAARRRGLVGTQPLSAAPACARKRRRISLLRFPRRTSPPTASRPRWRSGRARPSSCMRRRQASASPAGSRVGA